ncbi:MAG: hypothetical protein IJS68_00660 [Clostridia bacterium]|nr:hypothetical protein [Clostridia bacterium]
MKPRKRKMTLFLTILMSVVIGLALILTFIPMHIGTLNYLSFAGNLQYANDLKGGMYAQYQFKNGTSAEDIEKTVSEIRSVLSEKGYYSPFVAQVGNGVRIEIGNTTTHDYKGTDKLLDAIDVGLFELRTGTEESKKFIDGREHITDVKLGSSGSQTYVQISFNEEGLVKYKETMNSSVTVYVYMGGNLQTSFAGSSAVYDDMYLTFANYAEAEDFAMKVKLGSFIPVDFNTEETRINTMSSPYSTASLTADVNSGAYGKSNVFVGMTIVMSFLVVLAMALAIVRYRAIGVANLLSMALSTCVAIFLMQALPWIELSISSLFVMLLGFVIMFYGAYAYASNVQSEFHEGKTLTASLESGYKKSLLPNTFVLVAGLVVAVLFAFFGSGAIRTGAIISLIFMLASAFNNLCLLPWFVGIYYGYNNNKPAYYGLKGGNKNEIQ